MNNSKERPTPVSGRGSDLEGYEQIMRTLRKAIHRSSDPHFKAMTSLMRWKMWRWKRGQ